MLIVYNALKMGKTDMDSHVGIIKSRQVWNKKIILFTVGILAIGLIIAVFGSNLAGRSEDKCSDEILHEASKELNSKDIKALAQTVTRIEAIKGHESSASCMYVLTRYYISTGNAPAAKTALQSLKTEVGNKHEVSPIVGGSSQPDVSNLESVVGFLNDPNAKNTQNLNFDPPELQ